MTQRRRIPRTMTRPAYPAGIERSYRAALSTLVRELHTLTLAQMIPVYTQLLEDRNNLVRRDAEWWGTALETAISVINFNIREPLRAGVRRTLTFAQQVAAFTTKDWRRTAELRTAVNLIRSEPWLEPLLAEWSRTNAQLITSIPEQYLQRVSERTSSMIRQGRSIADYRQELAKTYGVTHARANLIARTEVAKLNGQITKARQQNIGVKEYSWQTAGDERVRDSHKVLNGKICRWDDPGLYRNEGETEWRKRSSIGGYEGDPGEDFMCRCGAAANLDLLLQALGV